MIVDWARNCENIWDTKRLSTDEPEDVRQLFKQELIYLRYLIDIRKYTKEECRIEWEQIVNGSASMCLMDPEELTQSFAHTWSKAISFNIDAYHCDRPLQPIQIFQSEINFINSLPVPLWARQYWCALLVYYKFQKQNLTSDKEVMKTRTVTQWACRHCTTISNKKYALYQDELARWQAQLPNPVIIDSVITSGGYSTRYFRPSFYATEGDMVIEIAELQQVDIVLGLVSPPKCKCQRCGAEFIKNSKTKRVLCTECYIKKRRNDVMKNTRHWRGCDQEFLPDVT